MRRWASVSALVLVWMAMFAGPANATADHVTICHRTGSASNPYVQISPSASGVYHGHLDHDQVGNGPLGDIIPPFEYQGQTYSKNWTAEGQAIYNNGCQVPAAATTPPTPTPTTPPPTHTSTPSPPESCGQPGPPRCPPTRSVPPGIAFTGSNAPKFIGIAGILLIGGLLLFGLGRLRSQR